MGAVLGSVASVEGSVIPVEGSVLGAVISAEGSVISELGKEGSVLGSVSWVEGALGAVVGAGLPVFFPQASRLKVRAAARPNVRNFFMGYLLRFRKRYSHFRPICSDRQGEVTCRQIETNLI